MTTPAPIQAVYLHVPFCRTLCGYCDFYSIVPAQCQISPLVDALIRELDQYASRHELAVATIFVGGGTPTTLPPAELRRLLARLRELPRGDVPLEFSVEANPATVTPEIAAVLAAEGVNRVSVGAQSFNHAELRVLERTHQPPQVAQTLAACRKAGLSRFSLDLIFAIPGQTLDSWLANLAAAITLDPGHLSCYSLTYEPGTRLHDQVQAGAVTPVDPDLDADMYEQTIDTLAAAGYEQYEISNFARPGAECRHNLAYWHNLPYLGIGPSAAGLVDGVRYKNIADVDEYTRGVLAGVSPRAEEERRTTEQRARETAMLELRLRAGINRAAFAERYGSDPVDFFAETVDRNVARGLIEVNETHVRLTRRGLLLGDTVMAEFL